LEVQHCRSAGWQPSLAASQEVAVHAPGGLQGAAFIGERPGKVKFAATQRCLK